MQSTKTLTMGQHTWPCHDIVIFPTLNNAPLKFRCDQELQDFTKYKMNNSHKNFGYVIICSPLFGSEAVFIQSFYIFC